MEEQDKPSPEEIGEVCIQLRRLSFDININLQVRSAIRLFWHNVPSALDRVKSAPGRVARSAAGIAEGWCKQPTGLFVQALKNGASGSGEPVVIAKEYPHPTLEQLNQLGEMGDLVYTKLNEPG